MSIKKFIPHCHRHHAISLVCSNAPEILRDLHDKFLPVGFAFEDDDLPPLFAMWSRLDGRERILRWVCLSIWNESTFVFLFETYHHLSEADFEGFVMALEYLRSCPRGRCYCDYCLRDNPPVSRRPESRLTIIENADIGQF